MNLSRANLQDVCFTEAEIGFCLWEGAQVDYKRMYQEIGVKMALDRVILHGGIQEYMNFLEESGEMAEIDRRLKEDWAAQEAAKRGIR